MTIHIISILVVLAIVFLFLRQENRKHKKYFGKKVKLSRNEKTVLEKYRQEYAPIESDPRLTNLNRDRWELEDVAKSATEVIFNAPIPEKFQRENLKPGDMVKLRFIVEEEEGEPEVERMWVKVLDKNQGLFLGELDNDPFSELLKAGQPIWFHPNHVFYIASNANQKNAL